MARYTKAEREQAVEDLRRVLKPGDTIYTVLRSVARSGMSRQIDLYKIDSDGHPLWLTGSACKALGWARKGDHMCIQGCGMDMGFHAVHSLSRVLFPDGFGCIGDAPVRCPSNDHLNGDRDYIPHCADDPHLHRDGGYALRHRWL